MNKGQLMPLMAMQGLQESRVVFSTSGPGATNLVTGIANAYMDSIPIVAFTGQVALNLLGKDSFRKWTCRSTLPITKHNF